jgi:hypothetical protein
LAAVADSLLPRAAVVACRELGPESPGEPPVRGCTGSDRETGLLIDRWGRVQRVIRHGRPARDSVVALYAEWSRRLATELGPGEAVCFGEHGGGPQGRRWQQPGYFAYVTVAVDTSEVELVYALGTPRVGGRCRAT